MRGTTLPREHDENAASGPTREATLRLVYARGQRGRDALVTVAEGASIIMGREPPPGGIVVDDDGWVSRHHAKVSRAVGDDVLIAEDLGSRNGTWVDGQRIAGRVALAPGQVLRVGATIYVVGVREVGPPGPDAPAGFVVKSPSMEALWRRVAAIAQSDEPVLVVGEIGSGKTAVARLLHGLSRRSAGPFVPHNSSAIPPNLEEATLFGVAAGFIPGVTARVGLLAQADGGTLFLDELGDLPAPAQAKLLDAFDPNAPSFLPVGGPKRVPTRCRLIVAVQRDVFELVAAGRMRHDLASRLAVARLDIPPLRARREDVLTLFEDALARFAPTARPEEVVREPEIAEALLLSHWTENVRGLESLARRIGLGETVNAAAVRAHADRGMAPAGTPLPIAPGSSAPANGSATSPASTPQSSPSNAPPTGQMTRPTPAGPAHSAGPTHVWPPEPGELLDLLAAHDFEVTPLAELFARARETVSRHITKTFGPGGKEVMKRAYRVWQGSGRAPGVGDVSRAYALWYGGDHSDAAQTARARWQAEGKLDDED